MANSATTHTTCAPTKVRRRHASDVSASRAISGDKNMVKNCAIANTLPASENVSPLL